MVQPTTPALLQRIAERRHARAARRTRFVKRLGVLLGVLAVPALAAETGFAPQIEQAPAIAEPVAQLPAQSVQPADRVTFASTGQGPLANAFADNAGPAATALIAMGSVSDNLRAQQCLAQAVYYEAASESDDGQRAVAQVVLNRVAHPAWPHTVCGVVYQGSARSTGCQFTFTCDGSLARRPSASGWARASRVARAALAGSVYAPVGLSTHYHTTAIYPYWAPTLARTTVIGAHVFYRLPGAAGQSAAFSVRYSGGETMPQRAFADATGTIAVDQVRELRATADASPAPPVPSQDEAAAPIASTVLPASGSVRPEYANAGRWIARP